VHVAFLTLEVRFELLTGRCTVGDFCLREVEIDVLVLLERGAKLGGR
jgi:hypothetical protein